MSSLRIFQEKLKIFLERPLALRGALLFLFLYVFLVVIRIPSIVIEGRFWCEEGTVFFHNALILSAKEALFCTYGGYLNLATTVTTFLAAKLFSLEYAPYFTTLVGLFFQSAPAILLLTAQETWLANAKDKAICLITLLLVPLASECWMQSLHIQIWLDLCCAIILCLTPASRMVSVFRYFCLGLASLSGLGCVAFIPLFFLRFLIDRKKEYLIGGLILVIGALIEIVFFYHVFTARSEPDKALFWPFVFFSRDIFLPFFRHLARARITFEDVGKCIWHHTTDHHRYDLIGLAFLLLSFALQGGLAWIGWLIFQSKKYRILFWILAAHICFLVVVLYGSMGELLPQIATLFQERYYFVGQALTGLFVAVWYLVSKKKLVAGLLFCLWGVGIVNYFTPVHQKENSGLAWRHELAHWEVDHRYLPKIWTDSKFNNWRINLNGDDYRFWPCYMLENPEGCKK